MDQVFIFQHFNDRTRWTWRRVDDAFEEIFYCCNKFTTLDDARLDAMTWNRKPYVLVELDRNLIRRTVVGDTRPVEQLSLRPGPLKDGESW